MVYGWALPRIINFILVLRLAWLLMTIFISKYDYSNAYPRMAHCALVVHGYQGYRRAVSFMEARRSTTFWTSWGWR